MIIVRLTVTIVLVTLAMFSATFLWTNVFKRPWTRDAHIRGSVVGVAPQVEGPIVEVAVANNATVEAGDVLFKIDETNYTLALKSAQANVAPGRAPGCPRGGRGRAREPGLALLESDRCSAWTGAIACGE